MLKLLTLFVTALGDEALILTVTVLRDGPLGRWLRLNEVIRVGPWSDRIGVPIRRGAVLPCTCRGKATWGLRQLSVSQEENSHQKLNLLAPWSRTSGLQNWENTFLLFMPPILWYFTMAAWAGGMYKADGFEDEGTFQVQGTAWVKVWRWESAQYV